MKDARGNHRMLARLAFILSWPSCLRVFQGLSWRLILYADGITPGAVLVSDNRRKCVVWYSSFVEFGDKSSYEEAWFPVAIARTHSCRHCLCVVALR